MCTHYMFYKYKFEKRLVLSLFVHIHFSNSIEQSYGQNFISTRDLYHLRAILL